MFQGVAPWGAFAWGRWEWEALGGEDPLLVLITIKLQERGPDRR